MRLPLVAVGLVLAATLAASAATAQTPGPSVTLALGTPAAASTNGTTFLQEYEVSLTVAGVACPQGVPFLVLLEATVASRANGSSNASQPTAQWVPSQLSFDVPAGQHVSQPYQATAVSVLSVEPRGNAGPVEVGIVGTAVPGNAPCAPPLPETADTRSQIQVTFASAAAPPTTELAMPGPGFALAGLAAVAAAWLTTRRR